MTRRVTILALLAFCGYAQEAKTLDSPEWSKPFPAFQIVGNLYYVGTYDLACYLIVTPAGDMLINTGSIGSAPLIRKNIESLGFRLTDVKLLLTTQGHWDHMGGMAEIKRLSGARMAVLEQDVAVVESGGKDDFRWGQDPGAWYDPVKVEQHLHDRQVISLGGTDVTVLWHPGHTKGSASYQLTVADGGTSYRVLIVNLPSINPGVTLLKNDRYPNILNDYASTLLKQKELQPEIFLSSHAGQFALHRKYQPGDVYQPIRFVDPAGYRGAVAAMQAAFDRQVARERAAQ